MAGIFLVKSYTRSILASRRRPFGSSTVCIHMYYLVLAPPVLPSAAPGVGGPGFGGPPRQPQTIIYPAAASPPRLTLRVDADELADVCEPAGRVALVSLEAHSGDYPNVGGPITTPYVVGRDGAPSTFQQQPFNVSSSSSTGGAGDSTTAASNITPLFSFPDVLGQGHGVPPALTSALTAQLQSAVALSLSHMKGSPLGGPAAKLTMHAVAISGLIALGAVTFVRALWAPLEPLDVASWGVLVAMYASAVLYCTCAGRVTAAQPAPHYLPAEALYRAEIIVHSFAPQLAAHGLEAHVVLAQEPDPRPDPPGPFITTFITAEARAAARTAATPTAFSALLPAPPDGVEHRVDDMGVHMQAERSKLCGRLFLLVTRVGTSVGVAAATSARAARFSALTRGAIERTFECEAEMKDALVTGVPSLCVALVPLERVVENYNIPEGYTGAPAGEHDVSCGLLCGERTRWKKARQGYRFVGHFSREVLLGALTAWDTMRGGVSATPTATTISSSDREGGGGGRGGVMGANESASLATALSSSLNDVCNEHDTNTNGRLPHRWRGIWRSSSPVKHVGATDIAMNRLSPAAQFGALIFSLLLVGPFFGSLVGAYNLALYAHYATAALVTVCSPAAMVVPLMALLPALVVAVLLLTIALLPIMLPVAGVAYLCGAYGPGGSWSAAVREKKDEGRRANARALPDLRRVLLEYETPLAASGLSAYIVCVEQARHQQFEVFAGCGGGKGDKGSGSEGSANMGGDEAGVVTGVGPTRVSSFCCYPLTKQAQLMAQVMLYLYIVRRRAGGPAEGDDEQ